MEQIRLFNDNCLNAMKQLEDNSIDSIVTDPPYGLSFMNKHWDYDVPSVEIWKECLRVLKPGGHLLSFAGSRTYHRMAVRIEDAGFEIRDQIMWVFGSGFPKSLNIGKTMDKFLKTGNASWNGTGDSSNGALGFTKLQHKQGYRPDDYSNRHTNKEDITEELAQEWEGWGTALKPAHEPIVMARKPFKGSVVENVLKYGTGGINIDESRIVSDDNLNGGKYAKNSTKQKENATSFYTSVLNKDFIQPEGRWPANIIFDEEAGKILDEQSGIKKSNERKSKFVNYGDEGVASKFFYCPKASKKDRDEGMDAFEDRPSQLNSGGIGRKISLEKRYEANGENAPTVKNNHPTVKPTKLMEYLIKLITPKNGIVLDPFMGSGSTGKAAIKNNFGFIGIEREKEYFEIAKARIEYENTLNYPIEINQDEL